MTAPNQPNPRHQDHVSDSGPLRLRMAESRGRNQLDGVWWPRTRRLAEELADLVDHFPADRLGRVVRVAVSAPDWDAHPRHVLVRGGYVKVTASPGQDGHVVHLVTTDRTVLNVLVVPTTFTRTQGDEAVLAATSPTDVRSASTLLRQVVEHPAPPRFRPPR